MTTISLHRIWTAAKNHSVTAGLTTVLVIATSTSVAAVSTSGSATSHMHPHRGGAHLGTGVDGVHGLVTLFARDDDLSVATVTADLKSGKSHNDIAGARAAAIRSDIIAPYAAQLKSAVAKGKLTAAQETKELASVTGRLATLCAEPGTSLAGEGKQHAGGAAGAHIRLGVSAHVGRAGILTTFASDVHLPLKTVVGDLQAGKTLDEIAGSQASSIQAEIVSTLQAQRTKDLSGGKVTAAQEQTVLTKVKTMVATAFSTAGGTFDGQYSGSAHGNHPKKTRSSFAAGHSTSST